MLKDVVKSLTFSKHKNKPKKGMLSVLFLLM